MSISCIAIDDDPLSLQNLTEYMNKLPELKLVQTFTEPLKALAEISVSNPVDIIFMDVEMPAISGIELASLLRTKTKHLIFTTAHAKYAIDAFKVDADAYLLKPYSIVHFEKTIHNLYPKGINADNQLENINDHFFYIPVKNEDGELIKLDRNNLIAVEDLGDDYQLVTVKENYVTAKMNITKMIKALRQHTEFIQISSSILISKQHIKSVLGDQILLSGENAYALADSHKEIFSDFIKSNHLRAESNTNTEI